MAESEEAGDDAQEPPVRLWVRRMGVYCDENQATWLVAPEEEGGTLKARIRRIPVPLGEAVRPSRLPASQLPHMWQLSEGPQYRDSNSRIWDIEHHLTVMGVEELLLKLLTSN
ncbi:protein p13 MTCP-1 [Pituophis catenifer annectens]|uniref:protein p13 MTCP-1 n=1 Tax=Pituophis catenifer annectens TaxID=94852 RepID=UPI003991C4FC